MTSSDFLSPSKGARAVDWLLVVVGVAVMAANVHILKREIAFARILAEKSERDAAVTHSALDVTSFQHLLAEEQRLRVEIDTLAANAAVISEEEISRRINLVVEALEATTGRLAASAFVSRDNEADEDGAPASEAMYSGHEVINEFLDLDGPPNTSSSRPRLSFKVRYQGDLFPIARYAGVSLGESFGNYLLEYANIETRKGAIVRDKIVRYQRTKGGVREPIYSYKRLPDFQVLKVTIRDKESKTRRFIHSPARAEGETETLQRAITIGWIGLRRGEEYMPNFFPLMQGSEFNWQDRMFRVDEITPQYLRVTDLETNESRQWPRK